MIRTKSSSICVCTVWTFSIEKEAEKLLHYVAVEYKRVNFRVLIHFRDLFHTETLSVGVSKKHFVHVKVELFKHGKQCR